MIFLDQSGSPDKNQATQLRAGTHIKQKLTG